MTVNCFYLYDRTGQCLVYREWNRTRSEKNHLKNMYGMIFELKKICSKLAAVESDAPRYYVTSSYALHYFDTPSGLRLILLTSPDYGNSDISRVLRRVYVEVYVEYVTKNPLYRPGSLITSTLFLDKLDSLIRNLPCF
mmetsp:Transcript_5611/g.16710  ORF Transcript_5611/g.16710 Transcript_5611/m.16710 type:complete len:138 (-) Transcript_5611:228-641(-)